MTSNDQLTGQALRVADYRYSVAAHSSEVKSVGRERTCSDCMPDQVRTNCMVPLQWLQTRILTKGRSVVGLYRPYAYGRPKCMDRRCLASFSFLFLCTKTVTVLVHVLSRLHSTCRMHWSMSGSARRTEIDTDNAEWRDWIITRITR